MDEDKKNLGSDGFPLNPYLEATGKTYDAADQEKKDLVNSGFRLNPAMRDIGEKYSKTLVDGGPDLVFNGGAVILGQSVTEGDWAQKIIDVRTTVDAAARQAINQCADAPAWAIRDKGAAKEAFAEVARKGIKDNEIARSYLRDPPALENRAGRDAEFEAKNLLRQTGIAIRDNEAKVEAACDPLQPIGLGTPYKPFSPYQ